MADNASGSRRVLVTGGSGFVGRYVVRELIARGYHPVCLVRSDDGFRDAVAGASADHYTLIRGSMFDAQALQQATRDIGAAIHLVGIIIERRWRGQTFQRVHVDGTRRIVEAARAGGAARFVHMSALGTRAAAVSAYHRTKWEAESIVRASGMAWTIFRPSIIHGPEGEFMELMRSFVCGPVPPVIPYFGRGANRLQPVSVRDVATCFVAALSRPETNGRVFELGGPRAYTWKDLYATCRRLIPGACNLKPMVGVPVAIARLVGMSGDLLDRFTGARWGIPFNLGQVQMSQEDSVCETRPAEEAFGIRLRDFEVELAAYGGQIR